MHDVVLDLLILLAGIWLVAVTLRPLGLPTIMGELIVGVLVGPAVFGLIEPSEAITLLADIGIFFLMFHAGVETQPTEFFDALKRSLGVALVGAGRTGRGTRCARAGHRGLDRPDAGVLPGSSGRVGIGFRTSRRSSMRSGSNKAHPYIPTEAPEGGDA